MLYISKGYFIYQASVLQLCFKCKFQKMGMKQEVWEVDHNDLWMIEDENLVGDGEYNDSVM